MRPLLLAALAVVACKNSTTDRPGRAGARDDRPGAAAPHQPPPAASGGEVAPDLGPVSTDLGAPPAEVARVIGLERVARGLRRPLALEFAPGDTAGRLFVVEQPGTIRILRGRAVDDAPFLDVRKLVTTGHNEQGLLGLAFHPDFADNRRLYVNYTDRKGGKTRVVEYRVDPGNPDRVDPATARVLLTVDQPWANHNGGGLEFGPDGKLYVGMGDGGSAGDPRGAGQDPANLLGKMLRLDVAAAEPRAEIVQRGLRNPWRFHFDRKTGDLYIGDVGQDRWEWVLVVAHDAIDGVNFGWNITEGNHCFRARSCDRTGIMPPVVEYSHGEGCSLTGGEVYRGKAIPELTGVYFYADYCTALVRSFRWARDGVHQHWDLKPVLDPEFQLATISSFGSDADGELYILSLDGDIWKLIRK